MTLDAYLQYQQTLKDDLERKKKCKKKQKTLNPLFKKD